MTPDGVGTRRTSARPLFSQLTTPILTIACAPTAELGDHARVWRNLHEAHVYVMTHVMELCRADGAAFTAAEAEPVLTALHVGVSFALGRWAAPMLPVGVDSTGKVVWEDWHPGLCDPARRTSHGWWHDQQQASLADFLGRVITAFADPDLLPALRLQLMFGI